MKDIIDNIINSYDMRAEALGVLVANTQRALEQSEKEGKANEQMQRVKSFVEDLAMDLNDMLAKFYFLVERKKRRREEMVPSQVEALADFANFVKASTKSVCSVLERFQDRPTFEEKVEKEIKELEACIKAKQRKFDEVLN